MGGWYGVRVGVQFASEAQVTGNQILEEVRLKLALFVTDQITKCRPSVFLGTFKMVCTIMCTAFCQRTRV